MRTFNEREKYIIRQLLDTCTHNASSLQSFVQSLWFGATSKRALIIQTQGHYAVFFLAPELFNDEAKRNEEVKLFFELVTLLHELHTAGYITIYRSTNERFYFFQETFSNEKTADQSIMLNDQGDYTFTPDTIHDRNKKVIYKGLFFHAGSFELLLNTTTGIIIIHEQLHGLLVNKKPSLLNRITSINLCVNIFNFLIIAFLFCFLYVHTNADEQQGNPVTEHTLLKQQFNIPDSSSQKKITPDTVVVSRPALYGVDISKWNGNAAEEIDPGDSISFIICKATEGTTIVDPDFDSNWKIIRDKNYILGAYHFYHSDDNPLEQAAYYISTIETKGKTDMIPIVDIEQGSLPSSTSTDPGPLQKNFLLFLNAVEKKYNCIPMIYTNNGFANYFLTDTVFSRYPLWLAAYTNAQPTLPHTWKKKGYKIWQKKNSYQVNTHVYDFDVFYGVKTDLYQ